MLYAVAGKFTKAEIEQARERYGALHPVRPSGVEGTNLGARLEARRAGAALRAKRAREAYARAQRRKDLDPAKRQRDLAALDPETRRRVENYGSRTHL